MAGKDLSKTFSDMESDDLSLETSVPTDLTLSPSSDDLMQKRHKYDSKSAVTKQLIERKQIQHDLQVLKIEMSQKSMLLESQRSQYQNKIEELEEQLNDALHQKQILQVKLESELQIQRDDSKRRTDTICKELNDVTAKQMQLEETNRHLAGKSTTIRNELKDLSISDEEYYELKTLNETELSLRDFIRLKFYNTTYSLRTDLQQLRLRNKNVEEESKRLAEKILVQQQELIELKKEHTDTLEKYQKSVSDLAASRQMVKSGDYKIENYDRLKGDRDEMEQSQMDLARQLSTLEACHQVVQNERDDYYKELSSAKQSLALLKQDKEYLSHQVHDVQNRCSHGDEKLMQITRHLDEAKSSREEMYEKYVASRDQYKSEYEMKLKEELEQLKMKTTGEIDRLRMATREMFERENRNLREARDMAISEKERSQQSEKEVCAKYEQLLTEFHRQQSNIDSKVSDSNSQLKIKSFECERTQMVYEEMVTNNKKALLEVEKLQTKFEVLTKEYYTMQSSYEKKIAELEAQMNDKSGKLENYEKIETELDDIVLQAAEVEMSDEAEKVLFSYGYGANVPSNAKRRMKQSVHLAQRVLSLEKVNTSMQKELETEKQRSEQLSNDLQNANDLLGQSQQPYNYLINTIRVKDLELGKTKDSTAFHSAQISRLETENKELINQKNQMSLDLEQLLNQKEEISMMKKVILSLRSSKSDCCEGMAEPGIIKPHPTQFTQEPSNWYRRAPYKKSLASSHM